MELSDYDDMTDPTFLLFLRGLTLVVRTVMQR